MIRKIRKSDLKDDFFTLLAQLSGELSEYNVDKMWSDYMSNTSLTTFVDVVKEVGMPSRIVSTASILIENKFLHCGSLVGHIEDVVCDNPVRGQGVGKSIVQHCINHAKDQGCYKVILDCSNENVPFYINCGMYLSENCMRVDL